MHPSLLLLYLAALAGAYLLPGPDMALVIATATARGARTALVTALGIAASRAVHVTLSGLGLAALMAANPRLLDLVRWSGALYLCWMAFQLLRNEGGASASAGPPAAAPPSLPSLPASLLRGLLTNLLNPKALLFCSLLLPQFVTAGAGAGVARQYLLLGAILVLTGLAFDTLYALCAARLARRLRGAGPGRFGRLLLPGVFILLAARLAAG